VESRPSAKWAAKSWTEPQSVRVHLWGVGRRGTWNNSYYIQLFDHLDLQF